MVINPDTSVVYDIVTSDVRGVDVKAGATLTFDPSKTVQLQSSANVIVEGTLTMKPANSSTTHTLRFINVDEAAFVGGGMDPLASDVGLWIMTAGKLDAVGATKTSWTRVAGAVNQDATAITLEATPSGWEVGDEISIAPTEQPSVGDAAWSGFDVRTITSINGATIGLSAGTSRPHPMVNNTWRAEVMNLTRNVRIEGTATGRSHIFIRTTAAQNIHYVAIRYVGPHKNGELVLGRYGLHFHHDGDSQVGIVVDGVVIRDYGAHAFVPHLSNGLIFRDDIAHTGSYGGYWWDAPVSATERNASDNITYDHSIVADVKADPSAGGFFTVSGFNMGEGVGNQVMNSVAIGLRAGKTSSGFIWPSTVGPATGKWNFTNNMAHNNRFSGTYIWQNEGKLRHEPNENFVTYHNGDVGNNYGAYNDVFTFTSNTSFEDGAAGIRVHAGGNDGMETFFLNNLIIGSPNGIIMPKHSAEGKRSIIRDCVMKNISGKAVLVQESDGGGPGLNGMRADFVRCTNDGRDLEATDFDLQIMAPTSVYRVQRRNNTAFQMTGPSGAVTVIPQFDFSNPGPTPTPSPTITPSPSPTLPPLPTPTFTPTPTRVPTATPIPPTSTPTPTPVVTSIPTATPTPSPTPVPIACKILSAFWAGPITTATSTAKVKMGTRVSLVVITNHQCNGEYLHFKVWENDGLGLIGADPVSIEPPAALVTRRVATTTWVAEYQRDGLFGFGGNPEYFFIVKSTKTSDRVYSRKPDLEVYR